MTTPEQITPEARLALAHQRMSEARERAEYHGWNGSSSRQYTEAVNELRAAMIEARLAARTSSPVSSPDERADAGRGAFTFALIATLIVVSVLIDVLLGATLALVR